MGSRRGGSEDATKESWVCICLPPVIREGETKLAEVDAKTLEVLTYDFLKANPPAYALPCMHCSESAEHY